MANDFSRGRRVGEQMRRELAELLQTEVKDPRVGMVSITAVEVSKDMAYAKVFISTFTGDIKETLTALNRAAGFLRHELGRRMTLRSIPQLKFVHDTSIENGNRMSRLIDEAIAEDKHDAEEE